MSNEISNSEKQKIVGILLLVTIVLTIVVVLGINYIEDNWSKGTVKISDYRHDGDEKWRVEISENGKTRSLEGIGNHQFMVKGKDVTVEIEWEENVSKNCLIIYEGDRHIYFSNFDWEDIDCEPGMTQSVSLQQNSIGDFIFEMCCFLVMGMILLALFGNNR